MLGSGGFGITYVKFFAERLRMINADIFLIGIVKNG